ncbi:hypothetical protein AMK26_33440 [Streptomyces sp. CB03234]|uniref:IclR family transcriptional regulator n=1 Tax=Streptomyces sp. (strain CB03234) TaxID=1703937 RepID=UPI00093DED0B|nr:IclR family transcriptional regulator [Streptomyces sp. CB03234]OKJ94694.1 hypothetical protein AMK26_33440 [Streptomyces sp. CB03234]
MAGNTREAGASVTSRALAILGAFDMAHQHLSLSDIARRTGLPLATAHRILAELVAWRALERGPDGRYRVGLRLWELGTLSVTRTRLRESALPYLQMLYEVTRTDVHLAVPDGSDVVYIEHLGSRRTGGPPGVVGMRVPLERSAAGLVLLAHGGGPDAPGPRPRLAEIRRRRCAVLADAVRPGMCSVAVPVTRGDGTAVAAVGLSVAAFPDAKGCLPVLLAAAGRIRQSFARTPAEESTGRAVFAVAGA